MLDYRFPTALQMVLSVAMAEQMGERSTSAILAYGLEANPSFIRKLMVPLTRDGIIVSTLGRNGSIHLGRPADKITLRDIYLSVIEDKKLWASRPDVPARCVVSANACWYFKSVADEAEQASLNVLARHTVASALEAVKNADTSGCDPVPEMSARVKKAHESFSGDEKKPPAKRRLAWLQLVMQGIAHSREHSAFIDAFEGDQRIVPHHLVAVIQ